MESRRIFFALWPDAAVRGRLAQLLAMLPEGWGRAHVADDLHLTLVFIGQASEQYYDCLLRAARRIEFEPFEFELTRLGYFAKAKVVSAEPTATPPLSELSRSLRSVLRGCGYKPERREYNPHVTLLRKAQPLPQLPLFEAIQWKVDRFCLVESHEPRDGRRYKVLEEFTAV